MSAPAAARLLRRASTNACRVIPRSRQLQPPRNLAYRICFTTTQRSQSRCFSTSPRTTAGMMPDSSDPQPPNRVEESRSVSQATEIGEEEYHALADEYMDAIHEKAEAMQEASEQVEVEYSAGVLSIALPQAGTYIINKQPPNKQIWLSSPVSGPKRYDWVLHGESMHQKEGGGSGDWVYLRDGTSLTELLRREMGVELDLHGHEERMKKSVDPTE